MQVILTEQEYNELESRPEHHKMRKLEGSIEKAKGRQSYLSRMWCEASGGSCKHMNQNGTGDCPECVAKHDCPTGKEIKRIEA